MAIDRGHRFAIEFGEAFPQGLMLLGEIGPDIRYNPDKNAPQVQELDVAKDGSPITGKRRWKATVTDPNEDKAKRASFEVIFLADVQPVPATPELVPGTGMRMIELEGLTAEPKVMGQGEFKFQGYTFRAMGIKGDTNAPQASNGRAASKAGA